MNSEKKAFRGKFGGYNKKDVNNYIAEENRRFTKMKDDMQKALDESEATSASLRADLEKQKAETADIRAKLDERDLLIEDYKEKLDKKDTRISDLEEMVDALTREKDDGIFTAETLEEKEKRIQELEATVAELRAEKTDAVEKVVIDDALIDKARSYDSLSGRIDEILEHARSEAQRIVKAAEKAAGEVDPRRAVDVNKVKQSISQRSTSIIDEIRRAVRNARK